jgi:hypothetical protein
MPAVAGNPNLAAAFERAGANVPPPAVMAIIEQAAGDHARTAQIQERAVTVRRDVGQTNVGREMCNRLGEVVALVDANNAGPE